MSQPSNVQTPVLASWLLNLFTPPDQAEPISGDLSEEFATMASTLGSGRARRWYWQQAIKSSAHLLTLEFRASPPIIVATALGGYILLWCAVHLVGVATDVFLRWTPHLYRYVSANLFWSIYAVAINLALEQAIFPAALGWMSAAVAKGKEMAFAITLGMTLGLFGLPTTKGWPGLLPLLYHTVAYGSKMRHLNQIHHFNPNFNWYMFVLFGGSLLPPIALLVGAMMRRTRLLPEPPVAA